MTVASGSVTYVMRLVKPLWSRRETRSFSSLPSQYSVIEPATRGFQSTRVLSIGPL